MFFVSKSCLASPISFLCLFLFFFHFVFIPQTALHQRNFHFQFPIVVKEYSAINHIDFCSSSPGDYLVTCSSKVCLVFIFLSGTSNTLACNRNLLRELMTECVHIFSNVGKNTTFTVSSEIQGNRYGLV